MDGGIAFRSPANIKTLLRRSQRKHSEKSYRHMKDKLIAILKPMPIAVYSADLENFRLSLFANKSEDVKSLVENIVSGFALPSSPTKLTMPKPDSNRCSWCGIWMPLQDFPIASIDTTTVLKEACSTSEPDHIVCQLEEVAKAVDELLEVSLCQAPCELVQDIANIVEEDVGRSLWALPGHESFLAAEVHRPREVRLSDDSMGINKYSFKRTRARAEVPEAGPNSVSLSPAPHHTYATDESTGECKSQ